MRKEKMILIATFAFILTAALAGGISSGPPDGRTGAPGDSDCTVSCHNSYALNSGDGSLSINNVPGEYDPEETYTITVTIQDPGQQKWGFELTVLDDSNSMAGSLSVTDSVNTQLSTTAGRQYIKQTNSGTYDGTSNGPVSWSLNWLAPEPGVGTVTFYAAGNAANSGAGNKLDYIYTTSISTDESQSGTGNQKPICTISSPSSEQKLSGTFTASGTSSDSDGTVERVEVRIDSGNWIAASGTDPWSYDMDTSGLSNGAHTIYARAYDGSLYSSVVSVNVQVDNQALPDGKDDQGDSQLLIMAVIVIIVVVIIIAAVLTRRGK